MLEAYLKLFKILSFFLQIVLCSLPVQWDVFICILCVSQYGITRMSLI
jgi:hypothetical protein